LPTFWSRNSQWRVFFIFKKNVLFYLYRNKWKAYIARRKEKIPNGFLEARRWDLNQGQQLKHPHTTFLGGQPFFDPNQLLPLSYSLQQLEFPYWIKLSIWSKFKRPLITLTSSLKWNRQNVNWPITKHFPLISKFHNTNDTSSKWNNFINWEMVVCCLNLIEPTNMRRLNLGHAY